MTLLIMFFHIVDVNIFYTWLVKVYKIWLWLNPECTVIMDKESIEYTSCVLDSHNKVTLMHSHRKVGYLPFDFFDDLFNEVNK
jgi:hypothetical protein